MGDNFLKCTVSFRLFIFSAVYYLVRKIAWISLRSIIRSALRKDSKRENQRLLLLRIDFKQHTRELKQSLFISVKEIFVSSLVLLHIFSMGQEI